MKRLMIIFLFLALVGVATGLIFVLTRSTVRAGIAVPTVAVLPTLTDTPLPTLTTTPTATWTPSATPTATASTTPTPTNTLATLVVQVTTVNSDVTLQAAVTQAPSRTPTPWPTVQVPTPAAQMPTVSTGTTPQVGWFHYDVTHPAVQYTGKWDVFTQSFHSVSHHYIYTGVAGAQQSLHFLGAAARLRYIKYFTYGVFAVRLDGQVVTTIDSYYPKVAAGGNGEFMTTDVWPLPYGWHTLEVVNLGQKNPASGGLYIGLDGIDVYQDGPEPPIPPTVAPVTPTLTPSPAPAKQIQVLAAPPPIQPTATQVAPGVAAVSFTIAYDLNGVKALDPSAGVQGLSVRLITADTNRVVASGSTDASGFVHLEATTNLPLRLIVPYLNKFWDVPARSTNLRLTWLIPAANQPSLIP